MGESPRQTSDSVQQTEKTSTAQESAGGDLAEYNGSNYVEMNGGAPEFPDEVYEKASLIKDGDKWKTKGNLLGTVDSNKLTAYEYYSPLDGLGRCGVAYGCLGRETMPEEDAERGDISSVHPSGWARGQNWERCHLIAWSLSAENDNEGNLITGTRYMNTEGMLPFEIKVCDYVKKTGNHVLYRVTPDFEGDNLLAKGVQMEAWSVEDNGNGICFNVFCYNVQPNIDINYETGESEISKEYYAEADTESSKIIDINEYEVNDVEEDLSRNNKATVSSEETTEALGFEDTVTDFIVNKNTGKIHSPNCRSVNDMAEHNKWEYTGTLNDLKRMGYVPCARCLGDYK